MQAEGEVGKWERQDGGLQRNDEQFGKKMCLVGICKEEKGRKEMAEGFPEGRFMQVREKGKTTDRKKRGGKEMTSSGQRREEGAGEGSTRHGDKGPPRRKRNATGGLRQ